MICDKCGFDMPASCCVIGNYWDCSSCKGGSSLSLQEVWGRSPAYSHLKEFKSQCLSTPVADLEQEHEKNSATSPTFTFKADPNCGVSKIKIKSEGYSGSFTVKNLSWSYPDES